MATVPDRPLVRDPIETLPEYYYELGVWASSTVSPPYRGEEVCVSQ
jgi:hypothetical protein